MEPSKSTENLTTRRDNDNNKIQLVLIVIALVVAVVSLVVACVGISLKGTTQITVPPPIVTSTGSSGDKIWSLAIGRADHKESYIDEETGQLKGYIVDFTNAVCKIGNKNCRIINDLWTRCWDSEAGQVARGGEGLMGGWYDGCAGWYGTYDRYRTFAFTEAFAKSEEESLFVKPGSSLKSSWRDQAGKKIGILDGWWTDEFCLLRNKDKFTGGVPFVDGQIIHYPQPQDLVDAVNNAQVDYAFVTVSTYVAQQLERVDGNPELPCTLHGQGVMTRQVNQELIDWWNEAQRRLMATTEYKQICDDLAEEHGHKSGPDAETLCFL